MNQLVSFPYISYRLHTQKHTWLSSQGGGGGRNFDVLNFCILKAKYYIHNKRLLDEFIHFYMYF